MDLTVTRRSATDASPVGVLDGRNSGQRAAIEQSSASAALAGRRGRHVVGPVGRSVRGAHSAELVLMTTRCPLRIG